MSKFVKIIGVVTVIALIVVVGAAVVLAQSNTPNNTGSSPTFQPGSMPMGMMGNGHHGGHGGNGVLNQEAMETALAEQLDITVEELETAKTAAREQVIQQAVENGTITQEEADQLLNFYPGLFQGVMDHDAMQTALANALGITVEELEAARTEGKHVSDLAAELGVSLEDVQAAMQAAHVQMIQQAVENGTITQEQANWLLSQPMGGPHHGPGGGPHHQGGFGPQNGNGNGATDVQPATGSNS